MPGETRAYTNQLEMDIDKEVRDWAKNEFMKRIVASYDNIKSDYNLPADKRTINIRSNPNNFLKGRKTLQDLMTEVNFSISEQEKKQKRSSLYQARKRDAEPQIGWVSQSSEGATTVNWLRYRIALGDKRSIPFYLLSTESSESDKDEIMSSVTDNRAGILNLKFAGESKKLSGFKGFCTFEVVSDGGCYLTYEAGVKALQIEGNDGNTDYEPAYYAGAGFDLEFPVFGEQDDGDPQGHFILGASLNAVRTSSEELREVFLRNNETAIIDINDTTGFVDVRAQFYITGKLNIEAGGVVWSNSDSLDDNTYVKLNYRIADLQ